MNNNTEMPRFVPGCILQWECPEEATVSSRFLTMLETNTPQPGVETILLTGAATCPTSLPSKLAAAVALPHFIPSRSPGPARPTAPPPLSPRASRHQALTRRGRASPWQPASPRATPAAASRAPPGGPARAPAAWPPGRRGGACGGGGAAQRAKRTAAAAAAAPLGDPRASPSPAAMCEPSKQDIGAIFKRLRSVPTNKVRAPGLGAVGAALRRCDTSHWRGAGRGACPGGTGPDGAAVRKRGAAAAGLRGGDPVLSVSGAAGGAAARPEIAKAQRVFLHRTGTVASLVTNVLLAISSSGSAGEDLRSCSVVPAVLRGTWSREGVGAGRAPAQGTGGGAVPASAEHGG